MWLHIGNTQSNFEPELNSTSESEQTFSGSFGIQGHCIEEIGDHEESCKCIASEVS
jgi:hypothetical protein